MRLYVYWSIYAARITFFLIPLSLLPSTRDLCKILELFRKAETLTTVKMEVSKTKVQQKYEMYILKWSSVYVYVCVSLLCVHVHICCKILHKICSRTICFYVFLFLCSYISVFLYRKKRERENQKQLADRQTCHSQCNVAVLDCVCVGISKDIKHNMLQLWVQTIRVEKETSETTAITTTICL